MQSDFLHGDIAIIATFASAFFIVFERFYRESY